MRIQTTSGCVQLLTCPLNTLTLNSTLLLTYAALCTSLGEKPYECPDCHEKFARNSTLKCHMAACQNGAGAKKGRKKVYECQVGLFRIWSSGLARTVQSECINYMKNNDIAFYL